MSVQKKSSEHPEFLKGSVPLKIEIGVISNKLFAVVYLKPLRHISLNVLRTSFCFCGLGHILPAPAWLMVEFLREDFLC
jgi:hypothetical protein